MKGCELDSYDLRCMVAKENVIVQNTILKGTITKSQDADIKANRFYTKSQVSITSGT